MAEVPPELAGIWEWFKANWYWVLIAVVVVAILIAVIRGRSRS